MAGVSTAVVSYVINNGPRPTSPEVRERVLQAIQALDYYPNAFARGLRVRRTNTVGLIVNDYNALEVFLSPYSASILTGLTVQLKAHNYYVMVYPSIVGEDPEVSGQLLRSGRLDGIVVRLVQDPPATDALLEAISEANVPCVCIERAGAARFGFGAVTFDDEQGAHAATSYLIERGHRRIAHLSGDRRYSIAQGRLAGYQRALSDRGLPADPALVVGDDWAPITARSGVKRLLELPVPPTAIVAASDHLAFVALEELRLRGYRVPEDIALIGFDDTDLAAQVQPQLTTVHVPMMDIGLRAATMVLEGIADEGGSAYRQIVTLPVELIRRGTA